MLYSIVRPKRSQTDMMMFQSDGGAGAPQLDFEAWRALLRSNCGGEVKVTAPNAFAGWMRPLSACGLRAAAVKIQCGPAARDHGCYAHRLERTQTDVRRNGADHYLILFQVTGQSTLTQIDQTMQLSAGDVALVDATRPATYLSHHRSMQWLSLQLPRKSLQSHLGLEPQARLGRHGTGAGRLLFNLIREADTEAAFSAADPYMQLAIYDLVGALFAASDPSPSLCSTDKLFTRICGMIKNGFSDPDFGPHDAAVAAGVSLRYVQKLFTARGTTCSEFIYSLRLDHAGYLLRRRALLGSGQPLSEIAYACGFRDYPHFARRFRNRFGYPPGAQAGYHQSARDGIVRVGTVESASLAHDIQATAP
jgi:AraC family transcriptional regulator, positive regulator of tynA and feaB